MSLHDLHTTFTGDMSAASRVRYGDTTYVVLAYKLLENQWGAIAATEMWLKSLPRKGKGQD